MLRLRNMQSRTDAYDSLRMRPENYRPYLVLLAGGVVIGALDIAYAIAFWFMRSGTHPSRIFQSIAAGILGRAAFAGGIKTVLLGALLHYFIAIVVVAVYWACSRRTAALLQRPYIFGAAYGLGVYCVMNYIVVPLSAARAPSFILVWVLCSVVVHAGLIGIPSALFSRAAMRLSTPRAQ